VPKEPTVKTIKRLFAVSGNRCAFPECGQSLIDDAGIVVGEICHIRASSPEGPRYSSGQTDEERHGFSNLVLMCARHHKRIDESWQDYTVDTLTDLKRRHEASSPVRESTDEVAEALRKNSGFTGDVMQIAESHGVNIVAARDASVVMHTGQSYQDVKQIATDVYHSNAVELRGIAERVARERAESLLTQFLDELKATSATPPDSLKDPDMQYLLFDAQRTAARVDDSRVSDVLVELLVDRANKPRRDLQQVVIGEAISTVGRLTPDQCDALTLVFLLKYSRNFSVRTPSTLSTYLDNHITPFLDGAASTAASFQHLQYAGCGALGPTSSELWRILGNTYIHCFLEPIPQDQVQLLIATSGQTADTMVSLGLFERHGENELLLRPVFDRELETPCEQSGISPEVMRELWKALRRRVRQDDVKRILREAYSEWSSLEEWWSTHPAHFQLTSVGIAIAHANLGMAGT
jgi:hypothetical protein